MMIVPRFVPVNSPGAQKLATGLALRAIGLTGGGALSAVGIMELASQYAAPVIGGVAGISNGGGGGTAMMGYDY